MMFTSSCFSVFKVQAVFFSVLFFSHLSYGVSKAYPVCPGVSTAHVADPKLSRSMVINFNPENNYFVFLRCGDNDSVRKSSKMRFRTCHVYRSGYEDKLCSREKRISKANRVLSEVLETAVGSVTTGGVSNFQKFTKSVRMVRELGIKPDCIGLGLMKLMSQNRSATELFKKYYEFQIEAGPFTGMARRTTRKTDQKTSYVFSQLDSLLMGGNGSSKMESTDDRKTVGKRFVLRGPAYFTAKGNQDDSHLLVNSDTHEEFCSLMRGSNVKSIR